MSSKKLTVDAEMEKLQHDSFKYFLHETNPANGLVIDKTEPGWPASIAATGLALASYPVAVERGFMPRAAAVERTLTTLRFFWNSPQGPEPDATGYQGFYYHFLDMQTGRRVWQCELSTVDSAFPLAGALTAGMYFAADTPAEHEIRMLADALYRRADWQWAQDSGATVTHGWKSESGFLKYRWEGYDEALLLYILGLGSPMHPLPEENYAAWASTYQWEHCYGQEYLYAGNVVDLSVLMSPDDHPHGMDNISFNELFTRDVHVIFAFHGYRWLIHSMVHGRANEARFHVRGFNDEGTTTTPFDMVVLNKMSRFHLAIDALKHVPRLRSQASDAIDMFNRKLYEHHAYIRQHFQDMPEIRNWSWTKDFIEPAAPAPLAKGHPRAQLFTDA